jgi:hypothetical protein
VRLAEELGEGRIAEESEAGCRRVAGALRARAGSDGLIRSMDLIDESTLTPTSGGSALAVLAPDLPEARCRAVRELVTERPLASLYRVCSLDREHPERSARNYWRGPVWANVTWLAAGGWTPTTSTKRPRSFAGRCWTR